MVSIWINEGVTTHLMAFKLQVLANSFRIRVLRAHWQESYLFSNRLRIISCVLKDCVFHMLRVFRSAKKNELVSWVGAHKNALLTLCTSGSLFSRTGNNTRLV